jgi:hypothetical protein
MKRLLGALLAFGVLCGETQAVTITIEFTMTDGQVRRRDYRTDIEHIEALTPKTFSGTMFYDETAGTETARPVTFLFAYLHGLKLSHLPYLENEGPTLFFNERTGTLPTPFTEGSAYSWEPIFMSAALTRESGLWSGAGYDSMYEILLTMNGTYRLTLLSGEATVAAIPLPAASPMLLAALSSLGFLVWGRRRQVRSASGI